ncbi:hypothetical protein M3Y95_00462600 [Aphelenchoides besseyi]|nr:hypothetical protein M3Y95_00462600 [Aphelenchoides besseyi]
MDDTDAKDTLFASDLLVHIGNAEIESVLPTASEYTRQLYDQIRDKEIKLGKMKQEVETLNTENEEKERNMQTMTEERDFLRSTLEQLKRRIQDENIALSLSHKQTTRTYKELESVRQRIQKIRHRSEDLSAQISKQQDYFEDLSRKVHERTMRRQSVDAKLQLAESSRQDLDESLKRDAKTIRELEIYLARVTKQIYDRQREIDELKLGQLDKKAETEGIRRMLRDIEGKQAKIKDKYVKTLAVRDRILETYKTERGDPSDSEIEVQRLKRRAQEEEHQVDSYNRKIGKVEEEGRFLERGYLSTHNKILDKQLKLADINAENNVLRNRIERFKVLSQGLQSGDSLAMYKAYIIGAPEIATDDSVDATDGIENILRKKEAKLIEVKLNVEKVKAEVESKRSLLQSKNSAVSDGETTEGMETNRSGMKSSRSVPDLNHDLHAPKTQLARLNKKRQEIIANEERNAISDLTSRKKKLADEVAVLNTQTNNATAEFDRLSREIENEEQKAKNLKMSLKQMAVNFEREEREAREKTENIRKQKEERMNSLYQKLVEADVHLYQEEAKRSNLIESLRQAEVDEDNLRNRYHTYKGLRQTQKASLKQLEQTQQTVEEWRSRVEHSKQELDELRRMLALSIDRNKPTREQLATLKPYLEEVIECEALTERKKQLESQLNRLQRQKRAKDAESSGEITIL